MFSSVKDTGLRRATEPTRPTPVAASTPSNVTAREHIAALESAWGDGCEIDEQSQALRAAQHEVGPGPIHALELNTS